MDQIVPILVPSADEAAARDLVRAREDTRRDLMRTLHRLSKLLLRQGIMWSCGAAWHHRKTYRSPGLTMRARWSAAPPAAAARGHEGNHRLHSRWQASDRRKKPVVAGVHIARELAGWCWSLATMPD